MPIYKNSYFFILISVKDVAISNKIYIFILNFWSTKHVDKIGLLTIEYVENEEKLT